MEFFRLLSLLADVAMAENFLLLTKMRAIICQRSPAPISIPINSLRKKPLFGWATRKKPTRNAVQSPLSPHADAGKKPACCVRAGVSSDFLRAHLSKNAEGIGLSRFLRGCTDGARRARPELYDPLVQNRKQNPVPVALAPTSSIPLFETLVYLPFALFPLPWAYRLWSIFQAIQLVAVASLLEAKSLDPRELASSRRHFSSIRSAAPGFFAWARFTSAFAAAHIGFRGAERKRHFAGGCLLGCGLFKFHLVFPAALPSLFCKPKTLRWGLASVAVALVLVSIWISGRALSPHTLISCCNSGSLPFWREFTTLKKPISGACLR